MITQSERFEELLTQMKDLHDAKRHDYANTKDVFANFRTCEQAMYRSRPGVMRASRFNPPPPLRGHRRAESQL